MSNFNRGDYKNLFLIGAELYGYPLPHRRREIAVTLMAMAEHAIGQQAGWPSIHKKYRHLTTFPIDTTTIPT